MYLAYNAVHTPMESKTEHLEKYKNHSRQKLAAMTWSLDENIGKLQQKLHELGLEENTIVYLLSDNGGDTYTEATDNGPLKGGKLTQFEGGINVPFMMKWKDKIPAGTRYPKAVSATDIYTTSVINAGGSLPTDRVYDGVDLIPYVNDFELEGPHEQLYWRADHVWAMRDGDYKLILSTRDGWAELYNLKDDKSEAFNIKEQMPALYQKLYDMHRTWQHENLPKKYMWPRIMDHKFLIDGKEYLFPA